MFKGTIQRAPCMRVISVYFRLNLCKLYDGPISLLADHDFTVRCIQVESIARDHWMLPLNCHNCDINTLNDVTELAGKVLQSVCITGRCCRRRCHRYIQSVCGDIDR